MGDRIQLTQRFIQQSLLEFSNKQYTQYMQLFSLTENRAPYLGAYAIY